MSNKCPCGKKKQSLLIKCSSKDCTIGWWHSQCAGFTGSMSKKIFEDIGGWSCPVCVMQTINIPWYDYSDASNFIAKVEEKLDEKIEDLKAEIDDLKAVKNEFENIEKAQTTQSRLWSDIVADNQDGVKVRESFVSTMAKQVVNHTNQVIADRDNRENNVILFNAKESNSESSDDRKKHDKGIFDNICQVVVNQLLPIDKIVRLGRKTTDNDGNLKTRPIKVCFTTGFDKRKFLSNLYKLSDARDELKSIRIQHDLSPDERELTKNLLAEAYNKNQDEKPSNFLYKVRGPPQAPRVVKVYKKTARTPAT